MIRQKTLAPVLMLILVASACADKYSMPSREEYPELYDYSYGWDTARNRIGLPAVKNNLVFEGSYYSCFTIPPTDCARFVAPDTSKFPRFDVKAIFWDSIGIYLERNYFVGPNKERLQVFYSYRKVEGWDRLHFGYGFIDQQGTHGEHFGKRQADSVLLKWGLLPLFDNYKVKHHK